MSSNERILNFLEIQALMGNMDHELLYRVSAMRDGEEAEGELLASDLRTVLAERREAVEFVSAFAQGFSEDHILGAAARHFLASIESDA